MTKARPARMSWITWAAILILLPIGAVAFGAWYALAVPGTAHEGPLPAVTTEERDLAARLRTHVTAIASVPHNIKHYAALERSAQYIERVLQEQGYPINRQIFDVAGQVVRNIEATREPQNGSPRSQTLVVGAHYDSWEDAPGAN